jgi:protoporphyrinogen oxidase
MPAQTEDAAPVVVLGGGLAGLAAAAVSGAPVYEADGAIGGTAASDCIDGFAFDRGIHVLQTTNQRLLAVLQDEGLALGVRLRQAYIHSRHAYTAYPFQINTAGLPLKLRWRCVRDFLLRDRDAPKDSYLDWMYANLGRGFSDSFLVPYSEKFWTVHPREMTHEWTGARVPQPSALQVLRGALWSRQTKIGSNATFRYPDAPAGFGAVGQTLARSVAPVHLLHRARRIDWRSRTVAFDNGHETGFERLISTIPLPALIAICSDVPGDVTAAALRLRANSIRVVNIGIGRPGRNSWHWVHFPEADTSFFRISFPHNLYPGVVPPGMSSISAEVAYSPDRPLPAGDMVARVVDDLVRIGAIARDDPIVARSTHDIPTAYCIYDSQRAASVNTIRDWLAGVGIITAGRYGTWSYMWSDQAIVSGVGAGLQALVETGRSHDGARGTCAERLIDCL